MSFFLAKLLLYTKKIHQRFRYRNLARTFSRLYPKIQSDDLNEYCEPAWLIRVQDAERTFSPYPKFSFLHEPFIRNSMRIETPKFMFSEIDVLERRYSKTDLQKYLIEDFVGKPPILSKKYLTSNTSVHHLYHVALFEATSDSALNENKFIIEWGGGYGNLAKIIKRINSSVTYIIIDLPIFSCLQWIYLSTVFSASDVNIIIDAETQLEEGKINLLPINLYEHLHLECDLFIGTWSLSESSEFVQNLVFKTKFFGAKHLLLAYQSNSEKFPNAEDVGKHAAKLGAKIVPNDLLPGHYYAFR